MPKSLTYKESEDGRVEVEFSDDKFSGMARGSSKEEALENFKGFLRQNLAKKELKGLFGEDSISAMDWVLRQKVE